MGGRGPGRSLMSQIFKDELDLDRVFQAKQMAWW